MNPVSNPFKARKGFLWNTRRTDPPIIILILSLIHFFQTSTDFVVKALSAGEGLQDLGGDCGGQHVDLLSVCRIRMSLFPVEEHPPAQQSRQLVTGEHLPAAPARPPGGATRQLAAERRALCTEVPLSKAPLTRNSSPLQPDGQHRGRLPGQPELLPSLLVGEKVPEEENIRG